ncbi:PCRF domain-containing protein, partial [Candidatus Saccharibacteria bacterium]|nr:PCRF domain-containing protein [Candidatus Saccharibacteria bacterium]
MEQLARRIQTILDELNRATEKLKLAELQDKRSELKSQMQSPDFWQDNQKAQLVSKQEADISRKIDPWLELQNSTEELMELTRMGDQSMFSELEAQTSELENNLQTLKKELRFAGPYDDHDVILSIYAGAGGTDAQDWAQMLLRMYTRWAESSNLKLITADQSPGEEAGIKSATIELSGGSFLYGKLAGEHGVHRLVRLSPFNADNLRQTSFAKVDVLPAIDILP